MHYDDPFKKAYLVNIGLIKEDVEDTGDEITVDENLAKQICFTIDNAEFIDALSNGTELVVRTVDSETGETIESAINIADIDDLQITKVEIDETDEVIEEDEEEDLDGIADELDDELTADDFEE